MGHIVWPELDALDRYLGPLPESCGHSHNFVWTDYSVTCAKFHAVETAAWRSGVCRKIADTILEDFLQALLRSHALEGRKENSRETEDEEEGSQNLDGLPHLKLSEAFHWYQVKFGYKSNLGFYVAIWVQVNLVYRDVRYGTPLRC